MASRRELMQYIKNTNGGATLQNFSEDWEPIGGLAWGDLSKAGLVDLVDGKVTLTHAGVVYLERLTNG